MEFKKKAAGFCKNVCPICRTAREKQKGVCYEFVKTVEGGVCPFCKSYKSVYGRPPHEPEIKES